VTDESCSKCVLYLFDGVHSCLTGHAGICLAIQHRLLHIVGDAAPAEGRRRGLTCRSRFRSRQGGGFDDGRKAPPSRRYGSGPQTVSQRSAVLARRCVSGSIWRDSGTDSCRPPHLLEGSRDGGLERRGSCCRYRHGRHPEPVLNEFSDRGARTPWRSRRIPKRSQGGGKRLDRGLNGQTERSAITAHGVATAPP